MSDDKLRDARNRVTSLLRMAGYPDAAEYVASDYMLAEMERAALAAAPAPQPAPTETWEQCKCGPCPLHPVADHEVPAPDIDVRHLMSIRHQALVDWGNDATDDRTQDRAIADALIAAGYRRIAE